MKWFTWLGRKTIEQKAQEELEEAERQLMEAEASIEAAEAVQQMLIRRIARLQEYLGQDTQEGVEIKLDLSALDRAGGTD